MARANNRQDITGMQFGRLTVRCFSGHNRHGQLLWECACECGTVTVSAGYHLKKGEIRSCGCLRRESFSGKTHGLSRLPEYGIWKTIKARCLNANTKSYKSYGARGITICERWQNDFTLFYADMGVRPSVAHSIEPENNKGNYEPDNCKWATRTEQARNTRSNRLITFNGETKCLSEWAEIIKVDVRLLHKRLGVLGWSIEKAITTPKLPRGGDRRSHEKSG